MPDQVGGSPPLDSATISWSGKLIIDAGHHRAN